MYLTKSGEGEGFCPLPYPHNWKIKKKQCVNYNKTAPIKATKRTECSGLALKV